MIWPASSPQILTLPPIIHSRESLDSGVDSEEDLADDPNRNDEILGLETSKIGYFIAVISWRGVYLFRLKPLCPVAVFIRSKKSIFKYGDNVAVHVRPDARVIVVTTSKGCLMTYVVSSPSEDLELVQFEQENSMSYLRQSNTTIEALPGPGEGIGVRELKLRCRMAVLVDSGISHVIMLDEDFMVFTKSPPAVQLIRWNPETKEQSQARTILFSNLNWLVQEGGSPIEDLSCVKWSKAMGLFLWTSAQGSAWAVTMDNDSAAASEALIDIDSHVPSLVGHRFHTCLGHDQKTDDEATNVAINARFSVVAVGCKRGTIYLYNVKDYSGNIQLIKTVQPPSSLSGEVITMSWSPDGNGLFAGYDNGWAMFSVYGMQNTNSMQTSSEQKNREPWLNGTQIASWSFSGDLLFLVPKKSQYMYALDVVRWSSADNITVDNIQRPILFKDSKLMVYRGHEQSDIATIDRDALLWLTVPIPASYVAESWPIRYVSSSSDGRYIAISGLRGCCHYSLYSGRWKLFVEEYMDRDFTVRGGMVWYGHILILAVDTEVSHEVRMYSRDLELDANNILFSHQFAAPIITLFLQEDYLFVYCLDNNLYQLSINIGARSTSLKIVGQISLSGIVHSTARVRTINCFRTKLPANGVLPGTSLAIHEISIFLLVDGMLLIIQPRQQTETLKFRIIHNHIEYYSVATGRGHLSRTIWAFDGKNVLLWLDDIFQDQNNFASPTVIPLEIYPLTILVDKGIIIGIENDAEVPRGGNFTSFKQWASTQLFAPYVLESYLRAGQPDKALNIANDYKNLKYFAHILEILLYRILDSEATKTVPSKYYWLFLFLFLSN